MQQGAAKGRGCTGQGQLLSILPVLKCYLALEVRLFLITIAAEEICNASKLDMLACVCTMCAPAICNFMPRLWYQSRGML